MPLCFTFFTQLSPQTKNMEDADPLNWRGIGTNPLTHKTYSPKFKELGQAWSALPLYSDPKIVNALQNSIASCSLTIVVAGTGSGKTMIVPRLALFDPRIFNSDRTVVVTNPKSSVTERNAMFMAECLDVDIGNEVGFAFRGAPSSSRGPKTRLVFATDGYLAAQARSDSLQHQHACIIIDEAHERTVPIDHLFHALKNAMKTDRRLRVVIMSATMDPKTYADYMGVSASQTRIIVIPGASYFPVQSFFMAEDNNNGGGDYIARGTSILCEKNVGDALFFVPTSRDAERGCKELEKRPCAQRQPLKFSMVESSLSGGGRRRRKKKHKDKDKDIGGESVSIVSFKNTADVIGCVTLYSRMPKEKRDDAASSRGPGMTQRVVFATNIAESSLTIPTLKTVIDSGLELNKTFLPLYHSYSIAQEKCTQSQITQRAGRVGRKSPGICYHLYSRKAYDELPIYPTPSILSVDLTDDIVEMMGVYKSWSRNPKKTFQEVRGELENYMTPPGEDQLTSVKHLLDHIDPDFYASAAKVPRPPKIGLWNALLLFAGIKHGVFEEMARLASILEECDGSPYNSLFMVQEYSNNNDPTLKMRCETHDGLLELYDMIVVRGDKIKSAMSGAWRRIETRYAEVTAWYEKEVRNSQTTLQKKNSQKDVHNAILLARNYHLAQSIGGGEFKTLNTPKSFSAVIKDPRGKKQLVFESAIMQNGSLELIVTTFV